MKIDKSVADERIESARQKLGKALNMLESIDMDIKTACEIADWNDDVAYQIDEAVVKLGYALATLTTWNDYDCAETKES